MVRCMRQDVDYVHVDPALDYRLREWGRWARQRHWMSACRSIEGRYRPEAGEVWERDPKPLPVDALDAWRVECAWRTGLPYLERMILRGYFVIGPRGSLGSQGWKAHVNAICRKHGVRRADWSRMVSSAVNRLGNQLTLAGIGVTVEPSNSPARDAVRDADRRLAVSASA
jgi:hypothetical protein